MDYIILVIRVSVSDEGSDRIVSPREGIMENQDRQF